MRMYAAPFSSVAVSVASDLFEVVAASGKPVRIHQVLVTAADSETNEQLNATFKVTTGSYTSGSGGGTITPIKLSSTLPAAATVVERNNTTQASAGAGTINAIWAEGFPLQGGLSYLPTPECRPLLQGGEAFVVSLAAPASSTNLNGVVLFEEL